MPNQAFSLERWSLNWNPLRRLRRRKVALLIESNPSGLSGRTYHSYTERLIALLEREYGYKEIILLSDSDGTHHDRTPTYANIMRELTKFVTPSRPSDYFFAYLGHSSETCLDSVQDGHDEYIIPCDAVDNTTSVVDETKIITDDTLRQLLTEALPRGSNLVALFDTCHSGTLLDLKHQPCNPQKHKLAFGEPFFRRITDSITPKWRATIKRSSQGAIGFGRDITSLRSVAIFHGFGYDYKPHPIERTQRSPHLCAGHSTKVSHFSHARDFTVSGGQFYSANTITVNQTPQKEKSESVIEKSLIPEIPTISPRDVELHKEIYKGHDYRIHSAQLSGRAIIVKIYEGEHATELSTQTCKFSMNIMHPAFPQIFGATSGSMGPAFIAFCGEYQGTVESIAFRLLSSSLEQSLVLGLQSVVSLASGLDYLCNLDYPLQDTDSFILLLDTQGTAKIWFDPSVPHKFEQCTASDSKSRKDSLSLVFDRLLQKTLYGPCKFYRQSNPCQKFSCGSTWAEISYKKNPPLDVVTRYSQAFLIDFLFDSSLDRSCIGHGTHGLIYNATATHPKQTLMDASAVLNSVNNKPKDNIVPNSISSMPRAGPIRSPSGKPLYFPSASCNYNHATQRIQVIAMLLTADNTPTYRELLMSAIDAICTAGFTSTHRLTSSDNPKG